MSKLGYTWYPKDWGNSESVFELNLSERGLYRELIDLAMLSDNKIEYRLDIWVRKFSVSLEEINTIINKLISLKLIKIKDNIVFIPSCEPRLNLIRGGSNGGKKSRKNKADYKPIDKPTDKPKLNPTVNQIENKIKEKEIIENKKDFYFKQDLIYKYTEYGKDVFIEPKWDIEFTIEDGERIYGNLKDRMCGGLSEFGIMKHCEDRRIEYVK